MLFSLTYTIYNFTKLLFDKCNYIQEHFFITTHVFLVSQISTNSNVNYREYEKYPK